MTNVSDAISVAAATGTRRDQPEVPIGTGPPTKDELLAYYPSKFTFEQLKTFVNSGDLGLLKRDKKLQQRYMKWTAEMAKQHGSITNYLVSHRLQWGKPDTLSCLTSQLDEDSYSGSELPSPPEEYFTVDTPRDYISIIMNDWPYLVPTDVEHSLIWTRLPIFHSALIPEAIKVRVDQDGLWGFTGLNLPPPSPSLLPSCLPALSDWGITADSMIRSPKPGPQEAGMIALAGSHVHQFVERRWKQDQWETAWFVNPPRLQSIPGLAHVHVFARKKEP